MGKTKTKENNNNVLKKGISMITDAEDLLKASQSFCEGYENQNVKEKKGFHGGIQTATAQIAC